MPEHDTKPADVRAIGARATSGSGGPLPFLDRIQRAFGHHDIHQIVAHTDPAASRAIGARAFAMGDHVVFAGSPDLHTAAHEAAHVVQQRAGVHVEGGGDSYEQHADEVADLVVRGASAEAVLDRVAGGASKGSTSATSVSVQRKGEKPGDRVRCPLEGGPTVYTITKVEGTKYTLKPEKGDEIVVEGWTLLPEHAAAAVDAKPKAEGSHTLVSDEDVDKTIDNKVLARAEKRRLKTPSALAENVSKGAGKTVSSVAKAGEEFKETARIDVTSKCSPSGVEIKFVVRCNPAYMCKRSDDAVKDLVPVMLEKANDEYADTIIVLEPTAAENVQAATATYTWECLARLLKLDVKGKNARDEVIAKQGKLGIKAQWFAKGSDGNGQNHTSGGVNQKGGSGLVPLQAVTLDALEKTEARERNTDWNMGERMQPGRNAFDKFTAIMKADKELATTLEAESEFRVDAGGHAMIVKRMQALAATPDYWPHFGILEMTASAPKQYVDTYYDVQGSNAKGGDLSLLRSGIVLRERHVATDPADTFLFAVKGATKEKQDGSEKLRMAAQVNLDRTKVLADKGKGDKLSADGQSQLDAFVKNTDVDNAFGRTLDHALGGGKGAGGTEMAKRMGDTGHIKPVLEVRSTRSKFLMKLEGGTAIDFSADHAEGFLIDKETGKPIASEKPPAMYSFEFGVGHPSLTASATASGGSGGGSGGSVARVVEMHNKTAKIDKGEAPVARPYHVAADLENPAMFEKSDFKQFQALRDGVIRDALGCKKESLTAGGNKAQVLARELGLDIGSGGATKKE